ncbi:MAG: hypothetical protein U0269_18155 [Polyangiales bacterium]
MNWLLPEAARHVSRANDALADGRPTDAEREARAALALALDHPPALLALARARLAQHHPQDALRITDELRSKRVDDPDVLVLRATIALRSFDTPTLTECLRRCLELAPQCEAAWCLISEWHLLGGRVSDGLTAARMAVTSAPTSTSALVAATRAACSAALLDEAQRYAAQLDAMGELSIAAIRAAVTLAIARGEANTVVLRCKKALAHNARSCALWSALARALIAANRDSEALEAVSHALVLDPLDDEALQVRSELSLIEERSRQIARAALDQRVSVATNRAQCRHDQRELITPFELVRKFRCLQCQGVMMCACDREYGERFLPHQIQRYSDNETREQKQVTLGFVRDLCPTCRGEREPANPKKYGSKIERYYWRELAKRSTMLRGALRLSTDDDEFDRRALAEITALHERAPIYEIPESEGERAFIERCAVGEREVEGEATTVRAAMQCAASSLTKDGYHFVSCNSDAIASLFGALLGPVIQSAGDPYVRSASFGVRDAAPGEARAMVTTLLPEDFGTPSFAKRRSAEFERHFNELPKTRALLVQRYDRWSIEHRGLLSYLWAEGQEDVVRALLSALAPPVVHEILRYLVGDYFARRRGWPSALITRGDEWSFVQVLHKKSRLSDEQRRWIEDNHRGHHWPFELVRVGPARRRGSKKSPS